MLRYLNGGESHGKGLIAILEGMPSGVPLTADDINRDLGRRQKGYGRGGRMRIEQDRVEFLSGVRKGFTLGTPITLLVANRDWENWKEIMAPEPGPPVTDKVVTCPRPGHAECAGEGQRAGNGDQGGGRWRRQKAVGRIRDPGV